MTLPVVDLINNFHLSLQEVNLTSVLSLKIPAICLYVLGGVLTLALFDRILNQFFHRER
jgi:hypothetical protein